jgi:hypothetical protein
MFKDPVVEEVRQNAARIADECGNDIRKMAERFRREQEEHADRLVRRKVTDPLVCDPRLKVVFREDPSLPLTDDEWPEDCR